MKDIVGMLIASIGMGMLRTATDKIQCNDYASFTLKEKVGLRITKCGLNLLGNTVEEIEATLKKYDIN